MAHFYDTSKDATEKFIRINASIFYKQYILDFTVVHDLVQDPMDSNQRALVEEYFGNKSLDHSKATCAFILSVHIYNIL
jgi:hypothetical protein